MIRSSVDFVRRFRTYLAERFPLARTALLVAAFTTASVIVSARLAGRSLPGYQPFAVAFLIVLILFYQMRACDEVKDAEDDRLYRPERPVPRGLVSLREVVGLAIALVPLAALAAISLGWTVAALLLLAWAWLALMTAEFMVPTFLRRHPILYLVSHMLIMPLIDLVVTGCEWGSRAGEPAPALWLFIALSFSNGCVLELGRKIWAPESERMGVATYSALWGPRRAISAWMGCVGAAYVLLMLVGRVEGAFWTVAGVATLALAWCTIIAAGYYRTSTLKGQSRVDSTTDLWVLACYLSAGYLPFLGAQS